MIVRRNVVFIVILTYTFSVYCVENDNSHIEKTLLRFRRQTGNNCRGKFLCTHFAECIHFKLVCNGQKDCRDGSDEDPSLCDESSGNTRKASCAPPVVQNGNYIIADKFAKQYVLGTPIPDSTFINVTCDENYSLHPKFSSIACNDGKWSISLPQCLPICPSIKSVTTAEAQCFMNDDFVKCDQELLEAMAITKCEHNSTTKGLASSICSAGAWFDLFNDCIAGRDVLCPPRIDSNSIEVNCTLNNQQVDCTKPVKEGTIAITKCKNYYKSAQQSEISISTCTDGFWDSQPIQCEPECGEEVPDGIIFIINNAYIKKGQFPWPVGIYVKEKDNYNYHCSGTIITPTVILSVARCFAYPFNSIPAENFFIGAGKTFKDYNATEKFAQNRQVKSIHMPSNYNGNEGDISVVIVKDPFELTNVVRPVCVDWDGAVESQNYNPAALGNVVDWSKTNSKGEKVDVEIRQTNTPFQVDKESCLRNVAPKYHNILTEDKICSNYQRDSGICKGDRGNGLAFKLNVNFTQKYFLRGIASNTIGNSDKCEDALNTLYTKVASYTDYIRRVIQQNEEVKCPARYRQLSSTEVRCILNGEFVDCSQPVQDGTVAISKCKNPDSSISRIKFSVSKCIQGAWNKPLINCRPTNPVTVDLCPPRGSETTVVKCLLDDKSVNCDNTVQEGTIGIAECKDFYVPIGNEINIARCSNGKWNNPLIHCKPLQPIKLECGEAVAGGELFSVNTNKAKKGTFPWHVALYRLVEKDYKYRCGGSIITPSIILSAAHCFTDEEGEQYPAEEFYTAAGKYYRDINSDKDNYAQIRQIKEYHIPDAYRGYETNFAGDLAVIIVKAAFKLTPAVQPVCIEWESKIEEQQLIPNNRGNVVGWGSTDPYDDRKLSEELKQLNAPYVNRKQCLDNVPAQFWRWVTTDKFCAGYTNGSSVCAGDSGGGMVFKWVSNNLQKYYIRGIVSVGPTDSNSNLICDNYRYTAYTKVSFYAKFILNIIKQNLQD